MPDRRIALSSVLLTLLPLAAQAPVDHLALGKMWTFENPPLAYLEKEYGFRPDQRWLDSLRLAALRLGERENPWCSASFVSPQGLIMTNHHCVRDQIAQLQGDKDWIGAGFAATEITDEVPIPNLTVHQLVAQQDVTAAVQEGTAELDAAAAEARRTANLKAVREAADAAHPGHLHQVVALYQGAVYQLYRYRVFDDLRLVAAPSLQTAHFGGDPDNFTYPRWSIDFSFVRAYQDGKPADTQAHYFRWRQAGPSEGEMVFVPGNPGNTNRLLTQAQLDVQEGVEYPIQLEQWRDEMAALRPYAERIPQLMTTLLSIENSYKATTGMLAGLRDPALRAKKAAHEAHFRSALQADPALQQRFGGLHDEVAALAARSRALQPKLAFYAAGYSPHLEVALAVVQAVTAELPEAERTAARTQALEAEFELNPLVEQLIPLQFARMTRWLAKDDPFVTAVLGDGDARAAARRLRRSKMGNAGFRRTLLDGGPEAVAKSDDPAVAVARVLAPLQRQAEAEQKELQAAVAAAGQRLGQALHAVYGTATSPDATMTLRFSDGKVQGYAYNGTLAPAATTFYGLYGRSTEFGGKHPFDLPAAWAKAEARIDKQKKVCFASTNDIVGGNSGSCVVDRELRVVGLVFDGNIESLANDFYYTQERARAVSVHSDAIVEALQKVYGLERIVEELRAGAAK